MAVETIQWPKHLGKHKEAIDFALAAKCLDPSGAEVVEKVESIQKQLAAVEDEKNKSNDGGPQPDPRAGRVISLSDILYRSEANSDASQDGPRSERGYSDYDEEIELDFEMSVSGEEGRDTDSNVVHGSLNLRIHRRSESSRETISSNGTCGSPSFSNQNEKTSYQPETVTDMKRRYIGHCNVGTDIKQASFLGQNGNYVATGSDDGRWFIWEKKTGRLIKMLLGDEAVVNCIQCHRFDSVVATSGIDSTIKVWTPTAPVPSMVAVGLQVRIQQNSWKPWMVISKDYAAHRKLFCHLSYWRGSGCMISQKGPCILLSVLRVSWFMNFQGQFLLEIRVTFSSFLTFCF